MVTPERRKADIEKTIALNPTVIEIKGKRRLQQGGKQIVEDIHRENIQVRIFPAAVSASDLSSEHKGVRKQSHYYGLLAKYDAGLEDTTVEWSAFDSPFGRMIFHDVFPQIIQGVLCGFQALLERET